jgi:hypothetical protein
VPKRPVDLRSQVPLLDIASYGRRGPGRRRALNPAEIVHASRTARGVPEVMIKVSGGARTIRGVATHLAYLEKRADLETDDGAILTEKGLGRGLLKDWDLEIDERRHHTERGIAAGRKTPKLVHNIVFSMPKGTPPDKLHKAVRKFATEKFGAQHRYAMALHSDQGHPHVHLLVKAMSERGERLNIYKATLRDWRRDFARYLRELGNRSQCHGAGRPRRSALQSQSRHLPSCCPRRLDLHARASGGHCAGAALRRCSS